MVFIVDGLFDKPRSAMSNKPARLQIVDALRGFALFGILIVHCSRWFSAHALPKPLFQLYTAAPLDSSVNKAVEVLFVNKFYSLFSFLFGIGFTFMVSRWRQKPVDFYWFFTRRMTVLVVIGLLHYLHWRGDILTVYALLGVLLPLFIRVSNRLILVVALLLVLNVPTKLVEVGLQGATLANQPDYQSQTSLALQKAYANIYTLKYGSYGDTILANANAFRDAIAFQLTSGRIFKTLGFFLLGMYAGRKRLFDYLPDKQVLLGKVVISTLFALLVIKGAIVLLTHTYGHDPLMPLLKIGLESVYDLRDLTMTFLYVAGLTFFGQHSIGRWSLNPLASVGKMALSNYLLQTLLCSLLFFGYGLGLLGSVSLWEATFLSVPIFLFQLVLSRYWLKYFRFGPVEWLWRSLTYGRLQPIRIEAK